MRSALIVLLAFPLFGPASAQRLGTAPLDSGTLIRIHLATMQIVRGRLLEPFQPTISPALVFCSYPRSPCRSTTEPPAKSIPVSQVTTLDVATGSHWLKGGLIGAGVGAVVGGAFIILANGLCDTSNCRSSGPPTAVSLTIGGFALGALFGSSSPRWSPVP
jgi:hypothetical protein